ncbi:hypothetical protein CEXT_566751 [Caerostris extrusa]|uniref:Uncharacterized protein n=1 Tax=Caerostris extrusa TaxID=172846 RepID=A0AAV4W6X1_CAEEX|nr:hypothetical protein CEXT_566751 [Caerostris extrusa]
MGKGKVSGHVLFNVCLCTRECFCAKSQNTPNSTPNCSLSVCYYCRDSRDRELIGLGMVWAVIAVRIAAHYCSVLLSRLLRTVVPLFLFGFFIWICIFNLKRRK